MAGNSVDCKFRFHGQNGFFFSYAQEQAQQNPIIPATTLPGLGLLDLSYPSAQLFDPSSPGLRGEKPWQRFKSHLDALNAQDPNTVYKVLYLTRHGFGYHNEVMAKVGRDAWNNHWAHMDGDGHITWADAQLNDEGIEQAKTLEQFWVDATGNDLIPPPESIYTSPLARALETTRLVFPKVVGSHGARFQPIVKELLRERLTDHTCDRRSTLTWIQEHYPDYVIEPGFTEDDMLWSSARQEDAQEHATRKHRLLEEIFASDTSTFIALTTHSYAISAFLDALNMAGFRVREGSSVAVLVKAEKAGTSAVG